MELHFHRHSHYPLPQSNLVVAETMLKEILSLIKIRGNEMADLKAAFEDLKASVSRQQTVDASVLALVTGLKNQLAALATQETIDPSEVKALAETLTTEQGNLSFAVTQGTGVPAALGTNANPILPTVVGSGIAISTDPVTPVTPVASTAPTTPENPQTPESSQTPENGDIAKSPVTPVSSDVQSADAVSESPNAYPAGSPSEEPGEPAGIQDVPQNNL